MKWSIETISHKKSRYNAGVKPRQDVCRILIENGYSNLSIPLPRLHLPLVSPLIAFNRFAKAIRHIAKEDEAFIQYPLYYYNDTIERWALKLLCNKCDNVTMLIHDVVSLRTAKLSPTEEYLFSQPHKLIFHTPIMAETVTSLMPNIKGSVDILGLFDYFTETMMQTSETTLSQTHVIAFAGSLAKSHFLNHLNELGDDLTWHLYGTIPGNYLSTTNNIQYCGKFTPDAPDILSGGWGLVWDGSSIDNCGDIRGQYLRYNSPHKCSLYLARGIPLIVWDKSAIASFVQEKRIGIVINSLRDIKNSINSLTQEQRIEIVNNAMQMGNQLRHGNSLLRLL